MVARLGHSDVGMAGPRSLSMSSQGLSSSDLCAGGLSSSRTAGLLPWQLRAMPSKRGKQKLLVLLKTRIGTSAATLLPHPLSPRPAQVQHCGGTVQSCGSLAAIFGDQLPPIHWLLQQCLGGDCDYLPTLQTRKQT